MVHYYPDLPSEAADTLSFARGLLFALSFSTMVWGIIAALVIMCRLDLIA